MGRERGREREESSIRRVAREIKSGGTRTIHGWYDDLRKISHSYYFTNFPDGQQVQDLWRVFERVGKVVDVFVSKRRNSKGKRFGFVRFKKIGSHSTLHKNLEKVWIGSYKLVLRYQSEYQVKKPSRSAMVNHTRGFSRDRKSADRIAGRLYSEVVRGHNTDPKIHQGTPKDERQSAKSANSKQSLSKTQEESVRQVNHGQVKVDFEFFSTDSEMQWLDRCVLGNLKSIDLLDDIQYLLDEEGFDKCSIKRLGGTQILLEFDSVCHRNQILSKGGSGLSNWFSWVGPWSKEAMEPERLSWLICKGVPLEIWNWKTFHSIGSHFGEVVQVDQKTESRLSLEAGRVRVKTSWSGRISKSFSIRANGVVAKVHIEEESVLVQSRKFDSDSSSSNYPDSDEDDDAFLSGNSSVDSVASVFGFINEGNDFAKAEVKESADNVCLQGTMDKQHSKSVSSTSKSAPLTEARPTTNDPLPTNVTHISDSFCDMSNPQDQIKSIAQVQNIVSEATNSNFVLASVKSFPISTPAKKVRTKRTKTYSEIMGFDCSKESLQRAALKTKKGKTLRSKGVGVCPIDSNSAAKVTGISISDSDIRNMTNLFGRWLIENKGDGKSESERTVELGKALGIDGLEEVKSGSF